MTPHYYNGGVAMRSWLGAVAGCMALCWGAAAADLKYGVASEVTTLDPHFFHLTSNTEIDKLGAQWPGDAGRGPEGDPGSGRELAHAGRYALGV